MQKSLLNDENREATRIDSNLLKTGLRFWSFIAKSNLSFLTIISFADVSDIQDELK